MKYVFTVIMICPHLTLLDLAFYLKSSFVGPTCQRTCNLLAGIVIVPTLLMVFSHLVFSSLLSPIIPGYWYQKVGIKHYLVVHKKLMRCIRQIIALLSKTVDLSLPLKYLISWTKSCSSCEAKVSTTRSYRSSTSLFGGLLLSPASSWKISFNAVEQCLDTFWNFSMKTLFISRVR